MNSESSLPGCIGYFGRPLKPNRCETCPYRELCKEVLPREKVREILSKILEIEEVLKR